MLGDNMGKGERRQTVCVDGDSDMPRLPGMVANPNGRQRDSHDGDFGVGMFDARRAVLAEDAPLERRQSGVSSGSYASGFATRGYFNTRPQRQSRGHTTARTRRSLVGPVGVIDQSISRSTAPPSAAGARNVGSAHGYRRMDDGSGEVDGLGALLGMQHRLEERMEAQHAEVMRGIRYLSASQRQLEAKVSLLAGAAHNAARRSKTSVDLNTTAMSTPAAPMVPPSEVFNTTDGIEVSSTPHSAPHYTTIIERSDSPSHNVEPDGKSDGGGGLGAGSQGLPSPHVRLHSAVLPGIQLNDGDEPPAQCAALPVSPRMVDPFAEGIHRCGSQATMPTFAGVIMDDHGDSHEGDSVASRPPPAYILEEDDEHPLLLPDSPFRIAWDMIILVFILFEFSVWSLAIFTMHRGDFTISQHVPVDIIRLFITVFWVVDLYVQSHTCKLSGFNMIEDPKILRKQYLCSPRFALDLLATLPIDLAASLASGSLGLHLMVIRALRLFRIPQLFRRSTPSRSMPAHVEGAITLFWFALFVHLAACIWIACATPLEQGRDNATHTDPLGAYQDGLYFVITSLTSVGFGDITPDNHGTRAFSCFLNLMGVSFLMVAGGRVGAMFITTDPYQLVLIERKRRLEYLMERNAVPWSTQREAFKVYPVILEASVKDYASIMDELPDFIQERISFHMKKVMLAKVPMFKKLSHTTACLLSWKLRDDFWQSREYLIKAGEEGKEMYFLASGVVEVLIPDATGEEQWAANLTEGSWFGEIALLKKTRRIASIRAVTRCIVYRLEKDDFEDVCRGSDELRELMEDEISRRVQGAAKQRATSSPSNSQRKDNGGENASSLSLIQSPSNSVPMPNGGGGPSDGGDGKDGGGANGAAGGAVNANANGGANHNHAGIMSPAQSPVQSPSHRYAVRHNADGIRRHGSDVGGDADTPSGFMTSLENEQLEKEAEMEAAGVQPPPPLIEPPPTHGHGNPGLSRIPSGSSPRRLGGGGGPFATDSTSQLLLTDCHSPHGASRPRSRSRMSNYAAASPRAGAGLQHPTQHLM